MTLSRRRFLKTSGIVLAGAGLSGVGGYQYGTRLETEWLEIRRVTVPVAAFPQAFDGFRIVLMSDFHLYPHTRIEYIRRVVDESNGLSPDLVALTGDFVLGRADAIFELAPALAALNARHGVFTVLGNHDLWQGAAVVRQGLEEAGLPVLHNRGVTLAHSGESFYVAGVDDGWTGRPDLKEALEDHRGAMPAFLLAHEPDLADDFCRDPRVSFQLSGHSHGGQVRLPGLGAPFLPPLGRKYDDGLYRVHEAWLFTNRGIGLTVPIRLNCRPELTEITLVSGPPASA